MPEPAKNGWTRVAFGDVVRQVRDRVDPNESGLERYVAGEHMDTDDLRIRRWGSIGDGYLGPAFHMRFRPGHVLYGSRRTYLRKVAVADFAGITANTTFVLEPKDPNVLLPALLPFLLQTESFHEHSIKESKGSVNPYINFSDLTWYEFALPPLKEQQRIAAGLLASVAVAEAQTRLAGTHQVLRRAAIDRLTEASGSAERAIGDVCKMQNGRAFPGTAYGRDGIRLLRPGNLDQAGYLNWDPAKTVWLSEQWERDAADFLIGQGEVVINLTAQSLEDGFLGRVCLTRDGDRSLLNQRIGRFLAWDPVVLPEYVFRVFQSSRFQSHAIGMCEGSKVKHLFWLHISGYRLRVPSLREQEQVVTALREIDVSLARQTERATWHRKLHQRLCAFVLEGTDHVMSSPSMLP